MKVHHRFDFCPSETPEDYEDCLQSLGHFRYTKKANPLKFWTQHTQEPRYKDDRRKYGRQGHRYTLRRRVNGGVSHFGHREVPVFARELAEILELSDSPEATREAASGGYARLAHFGKDPSGDLSELVDKNQVDGPEGLNFTDKFWLQPSLSFFEKNKTGKVTRADSMYFSDQVASIREMPDGSRQVASSSKLAEGLMRDCGGVCGLAQSTLSEINKMKGENEVTWNIWAGTRGVVAARHFDFSDNLYLVLSGKKTFHLSPPEWFARCNNILPYIHPSGRQESGLPCGSELDSLSTPSALSTSVSGGSQRGQGEADMNVGKDATAGGGRGDNPWVREVTLRPGEALFLPSYWYHEVTTDEGRTIAANLWWISKTRDADLAVRDSVDSLLQNLFTKLSDDLFFRLSAVVHLAESLYRGHCSRVVRRKRKEKVERKQKGEGKEEKGQNSSTPTVSVCTPLPKRTHPHVRAALQPLGPLSLLGNRYARHFPQLADLAACLSRGPAAFVRSKGCLFEFRGDSSLMLSVQNKVKGGLDGVFRLLQTCGRNHNEALSIWFWQEGLASLDRQLERVAEEGGGLAVAEHVLLHVVELAFKEAARGVKEAYEGANLVPVMIVANRL
uniref:JmjC domain-containing protein n=1 Tax=Chromera velia CCMP2878 TaxID=1169474 RepID=A0A0G4GJR2_9ALVE|eukprot:Cvel_4808.t1-p1 / transcript=Cvel_4808.t1 / gene=Cvel_4808 / organism=Chromera_velia_CCMP2878 / gene_product=hypothetical protein / transcript_product=hypothetical protein / location=Cvel_scaffold215:63703-68248(-) / protein_length=616 / sequence_SO=supercontig / SO=protein_coding / is_pseudo=false